MKLDAINRPNEIFAIKYTYRTEFGITPRYQYFDDPLQCSLVFEHVRKNEDLEKCEFLTGFIEWMGES